MQLDEFKTMQSLCCKAKSESEARAALTSVLTFQKTTREYILNCGDPVWLIEQCESMRAYLLELLDEEEEVIKTFEAIIEKADTIVATTKKRQLINMKLLSTYLIKTNRLDKLKEIQRSMQKLEVTMLEEQITPTSPSE